MSPEDSLSFMRTITSQGHPARDAPRRFGLVLAGDLLAITGIVSAGLYDHYGAAAFGSPLSAVETLAPFVVGWLLCASLAGLYRTDVLTDFRSAARLTTVTCFAAVNIALVIRASPFFDGGATWPFNLVMTGTVLLVVLPWRLAAVRWLGSRVDGE